jgi:hypothetical protein
MGIYFTETGASQRHRLSVNRANSAISEIPSTRSTGSRMSRAGGFT